MEFSDRKQRVEFDYFALTLMILLLAISMMGVILGIVTSFRFFWDYHVYERAVADFIAGQNPYRLDHDLLPFVYPPIFLRLFAIGNFHFDYALLIVALTAIAIREWVTDAGKLPLAIVGFLAGGGIIAVESGNFTVLAHFALIALSGVILQSSRQSSWSRRAEILFLAVTILASLFKFYFFAYALVLLVGRRRPGTFVILLTIVALAYIAQALVDHQLWTGFITALGEQVITRNDAGFTLMYLAGTSGSWTRAALTLAHEAIVIGAFVFAVRPCGLKNPWENNDLKKIFFYFLIAAIIFTNPRIKEYDLSVLFYCILTTIYHLRRGGYAYINKIFCIMLPPIAVLAMMRPLLQQLILGILPEDSLSIVLMVATYALFLHLAWTLYGVARTRCGPPAPATR